MKHWSQSSLNPDSAFIYWKGERGFLESQRCLSVALIANISVQLCLHCSELVKVPLKGPLWWMVCAFMAVCSRVCTSASIAPVPMSSFRLCGLVIKPTGSTLPIMRKKTQKGRWIFKWYWLVYWTMTGQQIFLFLASPKGSNNKKSVSSASFDPQQSICPSFLLVFKEKDLLP